MAYNLFLTDAANSGLDSYLIFLNTFNDRFTAQEAAKKEIDMLFLDQEPCVMWTEISENYWVADVMIDDCELIKGVAQLKPM